MAIARKAMLGSGLVLGAATVGSLAYNASTEGKGVLPSKFAPAHEFVAIDGYRTHVQRHLPVGSAAKGLAIVLLHGFGEWTFTWRKNLDALGEHFPTYAYDRYGFGLSDKPAELDYSASTYVRQLRGLLDLFGIERAVLVGHSAGGPLAIKATVELGPERIAGLVLASSIGLESPPPDGLVKAFAHTPFAKTLARLLVHGSAYQAIVKFSYYNTDKVDEQVLAGYHLPSTTQGAENGILGLLKLGNPSGDAAQMATQVRVPTLVLTADHDRLVPPERGSSWSNIIANAKLVSVHDSGHLMMEEQPEQFNRLVLNFVSSLA